MPENLSSSRTAELLEIIADLDLEDAQGILEEAREIELPGGFGQ
jgi:hypothetical protein